MADTQRSRSELLQVLRAHEAELRARGVETLTLFGSMARGDATGPSDVDLAIRPGAGFSSGGFDHFGRLDALRDRLMAVLGCEVDLVEETAARARLRQVIETEGVRAF
jgi:predicted nucleotidyltransferase